MTSFTLYILGKIWHLCQRRVKVHILICQVYTSVKLECWNRSTISTVTRTQVQMVFQPDYSMNIPDICQQTLYQMSEWSASIVLVFKKGDRHQASNYRSVSLTSIACKLLEHIVHSQVMDHYGRHNILSDKQHGFRSKRSCETQLSVAIASIARTLADGGQVDIILLDFSKAFDTSSPGFSANYSTTECVD